MNINKLYILLLMFFVGCSGVEELDSLDSTGGSSNELENLSEVILPISSRATRTHIDEDDPSYVQWSVGDEVALWATQSITDGSEVLTAEKFTLKYYTTVYDVAQFSSPIEPLDNTYRYIYKAVYPYPTTVESSSVSWSVPSTQNGLYDGEYDLRVAQAIEGSALSNDDNELVDCDLSFESIMHVMRFEIPEGSDLLYNDPIKRLEIEMPQNIVGDVTVSTDDMTVSYVGNSNIVTLIFDEPIVDGDGRYAYLFMHPMTAGADDVMKITAIGSTGTESEQTSIPLSGREFKAGHMTPVDTAIGEMVTLTTIKFLIGERGKNTLGEDIDNLIITANDSSVLFEGGSNSVTLDADGVMTVTYDAGLYGDKVRASGITIGMDSEHALLSEALTLSLVTDNINNTNDIKQNVVTVDVPYLFEEDFDNVSDYSNHDTFGGLFDGTVSSDTGHYAEMLTDAGLTGWSGDRVGASAEAGSVRVTCRIEGGAWTTARYTGRLDSPAMTAIKSTANIKITYNYYGDMFEAAGSEVGTMYYEDTSTTTSGAIKGETYSASKLLFGILIEDEVINTIKLVDGESGASDGAGYYDVTRDGSYTISNCTPSTRLSWLIDVDRDLEAAQNGMYWLYIDNVKVTVVP